MNKKELTAVLAIKTGLTQQDVALVVNAMLDEVRMQLSNDGKVKLQGVGTFEVKIRAPRVARNIGSGELLAIPRQKVPHFRAAPSLKELLK